MDAGRHRRVKPEDQSESQAVPGAGSESTAPPARRQGRPARAVAPADPGADRTRDRNGATTDAVLPRLDQAAIAAALGPALDPRHALLCTDGAKPYRAFVQAAGIMHRPVNLRAGQRVAQGVFHIQHVNAYHSRLKDWMRRFKGVSTRYLANYLGWRRLLERFGDRLTPQTLLNLAAG